MNHLIKYNKTNNNLFLLLHVHFLTNSWIHTDIKKHLPCISVLIIEFCILYMTLDILNPVTHLAYLCQSMKPVASSRYNVVDIY